MAIKIAVVNESQDQETRVALVPEICKKLSSKDVSFLIEKNAGAASGFLDSDYPEDHCVFVDNG